MMSGTIRSTKVPDKLSIWSSGSSGYGGSYVSNYGGSVLTPGTRYSMQTPRSTPASSVHRYSQGAPASLTYSTEKSYTSNWRCKSKHKFYIDGTGNGSHRFAGSQYATPSWFFENMSRNSAEVVLTRGKKYGNILVRQSNSYSGNYVISARYDHGNSIEICHYEVEAHTLASDDIEFELIVGPGKHPRQPSLTDTLIYFMKLNPGLVPMVTNNWDTLGIKTPDAFGYVGQSVTSGSTNNTHRFTGFGGTRKHKDYEAVREPEIDYDIYDDISPRCSSRTSSRASSQETLTADNVDNNTTTTQIRSRCHSVADAPQRALPKTPDDTKKEPLYMNDCPEVEKNRVAVSPPPLPKSSAPSRPPRSRQDKYKTMPHSSRQNNADLLKSILKVENERYVDPMSKRRPMPLPDNPVETDSETSDVDTLRRQYGSDRHLGTRTSVYGKQQAAPVTVNVYTKNKKNTDGSTVKEKSRGFSGHHRFFEELNQMTKKIKSKTMREKSRTRPSITVIQVSNPQPL
ncbi:PREDICTED: uncharacterized protein LOC106809570 [Priapulus caudatus]|uniref:Uncharacterized protein LOC106809570 n=1 Tax=Priapulus caudatus TaxID=37621 RepID=A0ABM1E7K6_PRICU|nr:PREDICTED: uncharacterized protein LOC106809570 [Priapulus caudatus]